MHVTDAAWVRWRDSWEVWLSSRQWAWSPTTSAKPSSSLSWVSVETCECLKPANRRSSASPLWCPLAAAPSWWIHHSSDDSQWVRLKRFYAGVKKITISNFIYYITYVHYLVLFPFLLLLRFDYWSRLSTFCIVRWVLPRCRAAVPCLCFSQVPVNWFVHKLLWKFYSTTKNQYETNIDSAIFRSQCFQFFHFILLCLFRNVNDLSLFFFSTTLS